MAQKFHQASSGFARAVDAESFDPLTLTLSLREREASQRCVIVGDAPSPAETVDFLVRDLRAARGGAVGAGGFAHKVVYEVCGFPLPQGEGEGEGI